MDLTKEIAAIEKEENTKIISQLYEEKREIENKIHIVTILEAAKLIDHMVQTSIFSKFGAGVIQLHYEYEPDIGNIINFDLLDNYGVKLPIYTKGLPNEITRLPQKVKDLLYSLNGFNGDCVSESFENGDKVEFYIDSDLSTKVLDTLLSKDFKKALEYNLLKLSLGEDDRENTKRPKL